MDEILRSQYGDEEWPEDAENMYERVEVLGRGSFGIVWMARRVSAPQNEFDDEYVALKNIEIKEEKGRIYAKREISILTELRHPNVIRLIRAFPVFRNRAQLVAMQMARGPNLQYLVTKRGALGFPLARLVSRHLIAAVSYLHGRAVLHRDIKPTNCILENTELAPQDLYDWLGDDLIWSDSEKAERCVASGKYKLMLVDFGFARALEDDEVKNQPKPMRGSIVMERLSIDEIAKLVSDEYGEDEKEVEEATRVMRRASAVTIPKAEEIGDQGNGENGAGGKGAGERRRASTVSMPVPFENQLNDEEKSAIAAAAAMNGGGNTPLEPVPEAGAGSQRSRRTRRSQAGRQSTARQKFRSMSALGTKAYAAPEIKHDLRNKTQADIEMSKEALTECVADYGMIVDSYSVGWTLRVILTGIPPSVTISQYMKKIAAQQEVVGESGCLCFKSQPPPPPEIKVRDPSQLPRDATLLISNLTKSKPEERMTVREAQNHPYIRGRKGEREFKLPEGDIPSKHGDPVIPLKCATQLAAIMDKGARKGKRSDYQSRG